MSADARTWKQRTDTVALAGIIMFVAAFAIVGARLSLSAHGDVTELVSAGSTFVHTTPSAESAASARLHVYPGPGYDGQFMFRLAENPSDLRTDALGVRLDSPFRLQRIGYPTLAWAASLGGTPVLLPWALVAVNIVAFGLLGLLGGALARDSGRHALTGLFVVAYWGLVFTLLHDLTEAVELVFLLAGILALRRSAPVRAGLFLAGAALTRETAMLAVAGLALARVVAMARVVGAERNGLRPGRDDLAWLIPAAAFAGWQIVCRIDAGAFPAASDSRYNLALPLAALGPALIDWFRHAASPLGLLRLGQFAVLTGLAVRTARSLPDSRTPDRERLVWTLLAALTLCLSSFVWRDGTDFRTQADVYVLGALVLLGWDRRLSWPAAFSGIAFLATAAHRVLGF